ncbi:MAG: hypothetical protein ACI84K_000115 [Pseudohongiellaceae bacterium]|jgi:hypothetical protein
MSVTNSELGPLAILLGKWQGESGKDIAPEPDGIEDNGYYEILEFKAVPSVDNAEEQTLRTIQYEQLVRRKTDDKVLHHQVGYWTWDAVAEVVCNSFTIARRVAVLAGGSITQSGQQTSFSVSANKGSLRWGIIESEFMRKKASTTAFEQVLKVEGDRLSYRQTTLIDIYGKKQFKHNDENTLQKV